MPRPVPADLEDALAATPGARERFWSMPADRKDAWVRWVERARLPRARRRRVAETVRRLAVAGAPAAFVGEAEAGPAPAPVPNDGWGAWLLGLALLAGVVALAVWYTVHRHDGGSRTGAVVVTAKATVPAVTGIRFQPAVFQLKEKKLASTLVRRRSAKPRGIVIAEKPTAGTTVPQGTSVTLVVSAGPPGVQMPDVVGLAAADAVKALQARKLTATLRQVASSEAPGTVLAQQPKAGSRAKHGTAVVLRVAKGAAAVSVPDVTGQQEQQGVAALRRAGLAARVAQVPSTEPKGTVVAQSPAAAQKLAKGKSVRLNVSTGARATTTQTTTAQATTQQTTTQQTTTAAASGGGYDYAGMRLGPAVQKIAQGRQQAIVVYVASTKPVGVVVSSAVAGSRERLRVSAGPSPKPATSVPDVTGEDAATAGQDLQGAGFAVVQVQWPVSDSTQDGTVVYETPAQAPDGSAIVVYVGSATGG